MIRLLWSICLLPMLLVFIVKNQRKVDVVQPSQQLQFHESPDVEERRSRWNCKVWQEGQFQEVTGGPVEENFEMTPNMRCKPRKITIQEFLTRQDGGIENLEFAVSHI